MPPLKGSALLPYLLPFLRNSSRGSYSELSHGFRKSPLKIGLCVSGGPDSMALAYLMKNITAEELGMELNITAFIVDHQARHGSREEASRVVKWLWNLDIPTEVLTVDWRTTNPKNITNFESQARSSAIDASHWALRNVETTLLRLIRTTSPSALALQGMAPYAPVPCCDGLWGIRNQEPLDSASPLLHSSMSTGPGGRVGVAEPGGTMIYRPLLSFPKTDLIATCESNNIPYVEDKTNLDPGFTPRNAVRALRSRYRLPRALQDRSILTLVDQARERAAGIQQRATNFLRQVSIHRLNLVSGFVELSIAPTFVNLSKEDRLAAANVVERIASLVSADSNDSGRLLTPSHFVDQVTAAMTPECAPSNTRTVRRFTIGSVLFEAHARSSGEFPMFWRLSRSKPHASELKHLELGFSPEPDSRMGIFESKTLLWDSRYWIQLQSSHEEVISAIKVRPFQQSDFEALRKWLDDKGIKRITSVLGQLAPEDTRYGLPVLTLKENIISFPTLSSNLINIKAFEKHQYSLGLRRAWLKWDVHYKVISELMTEWAPKELKEIKKEYYRKVY